MNKAMNMKRTMNREMKRTMKNKEILFVPLHGGAQDTLVLVEPLDPRIVYCALFERDWAKQSGFFVTWDDMKMLINSRVIYQLHLTNGVMFVFLEKEN